MDRLTIIKVGGKIVENESDLDKLLTEFLKVSGYKILVHGGGRTATTIASQLGYETKMVEGRRITDKNMLDVVTMVYAGLVNKKIVAKLQALGRNSIGLTGADLDTIRAKKRPVATIDYGFVGDVEEVNTSELRLVINENVIPVFAPLTHDGAGQLLNTNADTIASKLASELASFFNVNLMYCFEKKGVLANEDDEDSVIPELTKSEFLRLKETGAINSGMIPKLDNGFNAKINGVVNVIVTNAESISSGKGTRLTLE